MKKILSIFLMILSLSCVFLLASCDKDVDLSGVTFSDAIYEYDGDEKSVVVTNLPEGYSVEYIPGNKQTEAGTYRIIAMIKDSKGNVVKELAAMLVIKDVEEEHTCDFAGEWKKDENNHWHECSCGAIDNKVAHSGGEATETAKAVCSVCGVEYGELLEEGSEPDHTHEPVGDWKYDAIHHWRECECGAADEKVAHSGGEATITAKAVCSVCGAEYGDYKQDEATTTFTVVIGGTTYNLPENTSAQLLQTQVAQYELLNITVNAGDSVVFKKEGTPIAENLGGDPEDATNKNNISTEYVVLTSGTVSLYFKTWESGWHSFWMTGYSSSSSDSTGGNTSGGTSDTITIYLNTGGSNLWNKDGAGFWVYVWNGADNNNYKMELVEGNIYKVEIPSHYTNIIFIRQSASSQSLDSEWKGVWNQTADLTISTNNNCYTITGWGPIDSKVSNGSWSTR